MAKSAAHSKRARPAEPTAARASRAKKISITVDERVLRAVEQDARRAGRTLSSHVTDALARDLRQRRLGAIIERYEAEDGTMTDQELAAARAKWRG
jgi:hypothetical protein